MSAGALHRHKQILVDQTETTNDVVNGSTYLLKPLFGDDASDTAQSFKASILFTQTGGATSPTSQVFIQTSHDGANWFTVASSTQLTSDGQVAEIQDLDTLLRYVKAVVVLGGSTNPDITAVVHLISNGGFSAAVQS